MTHPCDWLTNWHMKTLLLLVGVLFISPTFAGSLSKWSYDCGNMKVWGEGTDRNKISCRVSQEISGANAEDKKEMREIGSEYSLETETQDGKTLYFYQCTTSYEMDTWDSESGDTKALITISARTELPSWKTFDPENRRPVYVEQSHRFYSTYIDHDSMHWSSVSTCFKSAVYK